MEKSTYIKKKTRAPDLDTKLEFDYFYGNEADSYAFYRIPKQLITDERFKQLSNDAKILYGLMLYRMSLSLKNGWLRSHLQFANVRGLGTRPDKQICNCGYGCPACTLKRK